MSKPRRRLPALRRIAIAAALAVTGSAHTAPIIWLGGADDRWDNGANWNSGAVPGLTDDLLLGTADTNLGYSGLGIRGFTGSGRLSITGGALDFASASSIGALAFSNGTVTSAATLDVTGGATWSGGTFAGTGTTVFHDALALGAGGTVVAIERRIDFGGNTSWTGGTFYTGSGANLVNNAAFNDMATAGTYSSINNGYGGAMSTFVNNGSYTKTGEGEGTIAVAFQNNGTLAVNAGTLHLGAGSGGPGSINVGAAGILDFNGGDHVLSGALGGSGRLSFSGGNATLGADNDFGGQVSVSGGAVNLNGNLTAAALDLTGGSIAGTGTLTVTGAASWLSGTMEGGGSTIFNGPVTLANGSGIVAIGRTIDFRGATSWSGGAFYTGSGASLINNGSFSDNAALGMSSYIGNGYGGAPSSLFNHGAYVKTGGGDTTIALDFQNTGTLTVDAGILHLSGGGGGAGSINVGAAGILDFNGGDFVLGGSLAGNGKLLMSTGSATLDGANHFDGQLAVVGGTLTVNGKLNDINQINGQFAVSGGTVNLNGDLTATNLDLTGGSIGGAGALTITGASNWLSGTMEGGGSTTFKGPVTLANGSGIVAVGRTIDFRGATDWNGGVFYTGSGATLINSGTFTDSVTLGGYSYIGNGYGGAASTFVNSGTYSKTGAGDTTIGLAFGNTGTLVVNAGILHLGGGGAGAGAVQIGTDGVLDFNGGDHVLGGALSGSGRVLTSGGSAAFDGNSQFGGQLAVSGGALNVNGTLTAASVDQVGGSIGGSGALTISGAASWTGGMMDGSGGTRFAGALELGNGGTLVALGRTVDFGGVTSWKGGVFYTGSGATLLNSGVFNDVGAAGGYSYMANGYGGAASSFINSGSYIKAGSGETTLGNAFDNQGTLAVNAGILHLGGGGASTGNITVGAGGTLDFNGGDHALSGGLAGSGRLLTSNGTVSIAGNHGFGGQLAVTSGSVNVNGNLTAAGLEMTGGSVGGSGALTISGAGSWTAGIMDGSGSTTFSGPLALGAGGTAIALGRTVDFGGVTTFGDTTFYTGSGATLINSGSFNDTSTSYSYVANGYGGAPSSFHNSGTYTKSGAGAAYLGIDFSNSGTVAVDGGTLTLGSGFSNFADHTLTGGAYRVSGDGVLQWTNSDIVNNAAMIELGGATARLVDINTAQSALTNFANNTGAGTFSLRNGASFAAASDFGNGGVIEVGSGSAFSASGAFGNLAGAQVQLSGGSVNAASVSNAGAIAGHGKVGTAVANSGTVRASGGTLELVQGASGGALVVDGGATLKLGAAASAATLAQNGTLALGANNVTISTSYDNANFGVGNSFNRRAGVTGGGGILASGTTAQQLSGASVSNGNSAVATLALANVRVGSGVSASYTLSNVGSGGPSLQGALQTGGISGGTLSGSGVTAQNWGALTQNGAGVTYGVTWTPLAGGALTGQSVALVNNFDNVAGQTLLITGKAYNLASASGAPQTVTLAAQRVGGNASASLGVSNLAADNGYSERLNATIAASGAITAGGSISLLAAGATSNALHVGVDTATAGLKSGTATVTLASDGSGTSGFGALALGTQAVQVAGKVYATAVAQVGTPAVNFGIVRVGDVAGRTVTVSNNASGALTDSLKASLTGTAGTAFASAGSATVAAGASDSTGLTVKLDTSKAGVYSGSGHVAFGSHNADMADLALAGASVSYAATVNQYAAAAFVKDSGYASLTGADGYYTLDFGTIKLGGTGATASLSLLNSVTGQADDLAGSFDLSALLNGGAISVDGLGAFSGLAAGDALHGLSFTLAGGTAGSFDSVILLKSFSTNASDANGFALGDITLHVQGNVQGNVLAVPEPGTYLMYIGGLLLLGSVARRRRAV
nr:choice-of-anchor D domain-containing protein [uncultured Duganella sp.]